MKSITSLLAASALIIGGITFTGCADRDTPRSTPPETTPPAGGGTAPATPPPAPAN